MSRIIQILIKNHVFFLFIFLECLSLKIFISNNFVAESGLSKKMTKISAQLFNKEKEIHEYFFLRQLHDSLLIENKRLIERNLFLSNQLENNNNISISNSEDLNSKFIIQTRILKNSWNKKQNFMTIQVGEKDSVKSNMGVVNSENSLVGITYTTTDHFSTVISLLNTNLMISAKIKTLGHYGSLMWNGKNPHTMQLYDIPKHAKVEIGDTVITSGYSNILPENINIGVISKYNPEKNTNFLNISIDLFTDFTNINSVYVVNSLWKSEREMLEKKLNQ